MRGTEALAVKPDANQSNTGLASNHHRKLCVLQPRMCNPGDSKEAVYQEYLYTDHDVDDWGTPLATDLFTASSDNQEYKKLGVRGEGRLATG